jgi:hypothetical protein
MSLFIIFSLFFPIITIGGVSENANQISIGTPPDHVKMKWSKGYGENIGKYETFAADDIDGDGNIELIFGDQEGFVHIIEYNNGSYVEEWRSEQLAEKSFSGIIVDDIDNDGVKEIIVGTTLYNGIFIFNGINRTLEQRYDQLFNQFRDMAVGDIDGDGIKEIINLQYTIPHLIILNGNNLTRKWLNNSDNPNYRINSEWEVETADLDNDNIQEIIIGNDVYSYVVIDGSDNTKIGGNSSLKGMGLNEISLKDLDGDANKEIIIGTTTHWNGNINLTLDFGEQKMI